MAPSPTATPQHRRQVPPARALGPSARLAYREGSCLPARFPEMSCRRCTVACPTGALVATSGGPELASGCVDCGRCAVACPTEALSVPGLDSTPPTSGMIAIEMLQTARHTGLGWTLTIARMRWLNGARTPPEDTGRIRAHLARTQPADPARAIVEYGLAALLALLPVAWALRRWSRRSSATDRTPREPGK
jgi:Fe-S-cluster-containing hydrogenase component 2